MKSPLKVVRVFSGTFASHAAAMMYSQAQWEAEPAEEASDEAYSEWEDRNPSWKLKSEIGQYLDEDFIETIFGEQSWAYLETVIGIEKAQQLRRLDSGTSNTLILIYDESEPDTSSAQSARMTVHFLVKFTPV